ncbi:hypothetical protein L210DRAFT_3499748 [Boletus edulis BED1]|uniref:Uncharacterized protein n=1 Tax=Boletus edulis BED1 TaxID=1328754 RepID=A0AAD4C9T3_BOLED|nr:hypothetical protein L210DRAFT_3499748 [Boletus edulis BED1]
MHYRSTWINDGNCHVTGPRLHVEVFLEDGDYRNHLRRSALILDFGPQRRRNFFTCLVGLKFMTRSQQQHATPDNELASGPGLANASKRSVSFLPLPYTSDSVPLPRIDLRQNDDIIRRREELSLPAMPNSALTLSPHPYLPNARQAHQRDCEVFSPSSSFLIYPFSGVFIQGLTFAYYDPFRDFPHSSLSANDRICIGYFRTRKALAPPVFVKDTSAVSSTPPRHLAETVSLASLFAFSTNNNNQLIHVHR